jgi:hypothetical protein
MFDAVKVDLSAAANRAAHAKAGGVVVQDADGGDEGRKGGGATSGAHSSLQRRQMLEKQSHLVRKVNVQRMMAHAGVGTLWQIAGAFLVVILFSFFLTSGKASGGRRGWDNAASLPYNTLDDGEIGAAWTTQRLCKHFGAPTPSRVRFLFGVDSPKMLQSSVKAWRRIDVIQVNVGFRLHTDMPPAEAHGWRHRAKGAFDKVTGRSTIGSPAIVADASPYTARTSLFTLYDFLNMFYQQVLDSHQPVGREQGLMVTFVDPRAIEPSLRLIQLATRLGRLPGPLIVDGEILPGPGGFLAQLGSVFVEPPSHDETHSHEEQDHHLFVPPVPGDVDAASLASRREKTFDFDPRFDFVDKIKKFAPGSQFCRLDGPRTAGAWTARSRLGRARRTGSGTRASPSTGAGRRRSRRFRRARSRRRRRRTCSPSPGTSVRRSRARSPPSQEDGAWCSRTPATKRTKATTRIRRRTRRRTIPT